MSNKKENTAMTTAAEAHRLVPRLRFPKFKGKEGWEKRTLADLLQEHGNKSTGIEEVFSVSVHKGLVNQVEHLGRSFAASSTAHYKRVLPGDIVYTKSPTGDFPLGIIKQSKLDFDVIVSPLYGVFSPETNTLGALLDAYFESPENALIYLEPLAQKGAKNTININNSKFLSGFLILPTEEAEQQKIAECLSSIDELITLESQKLDTLKRHKKGLMQQLFPREGEAVPKLRFPELKESWGFINIGDFFDLTDKAEKTTAFDKEKVLTVKLHAAGVVKSKRTTLTGAANYFNRKAGQFIFSKIDLLNGAFGVIPNSLDGFASSSDVPTYSFNAKHSSSFFIHWLKAKYEFLEIERTGTSSTLKRVSPEKFLSLAILVPTFAEQQKIADCLTSLDDRITSQTQKIESLKTHKRGLMQQLFPTMGEV